MLKQKSTKGWAERFDHIDGHFKTRKIEEWYCPEAGCLKGDRNAKAESDADGSSSESEEVEEGKDHDGETPPSVAIGETVSSQAKRRPGVASSVLLQPSRPRAVSQQGQATGAASEVPAPTSWPNLAPRS